MVQTRQPTTNPKLLPSHNPTHQPPRPTHRPTTTPSHGRKQNRTTHTRHRNPQQPHHTPTTQLQRHTHRLPHHSQNHKTKPLGTSLQRPSKPQPTTKPKLLLDILPTLNPNQPGINKLLATTTTQYTHAQTQGWAPPLNQNTHIWLNQITGTTQTAKYAHTLKQLDTKNPTALAVD